MGFYHNFHDSSVISRPEPGSMPYEVGKLICDPVKQTYNKLELELQCSGIHRRRYAYR